MRGQAYWIAAATVLLCTVVLGQTAAALGPTAQIKQTVDRMLEVLQDPRLTPESKQLERRRLLRAIADESFDFEEMSRRVMAMHWRALTEVQRREFVGLFSELLERDYTSKIEQYSGETILYNGERVDDDAATVSTRIVRKDGTEIPVDYRLRRRNGRWLTYDVSIERISLVGNYRTQFHNVIQTSSYETLVKKLRIRIEELQLAR
jgi:phospholipid transport system substrate-binding protein